MKEDGKLAEEMRVERVSPGQQPVTDRILTRRDAIETDKTNPICERGWGADISSKLDLDSQLQNIAEPGPESRSSFIYLNTLPRSGKIRLLGCKCVFIKCPVCFTFFSQADRLLNDTVNSS